MRVLVVAGARPNFMKVAPILRSLTSTGHEALLVHTGQHYDARMSDAFFADLAIPEPDFHLEVGSGTHAVQTGRIMEAFEPVLVQTQPDWVIVVGDVNSTVACALVAVKLKENIGCRVAHVEAGLRSGDWRMPEEVNRVLTDRIADLLLTPSRDAKLHLLAEGIPAERIVFVGNVMIDTLLAQLPKATALRVPNELGLEPYQYTVATLHRPSTVDHAKQLNEALEGLSRVAAEMPVVLPLHPRTRQNIRNFDLQRQLKSIRLTEPLGYTQMLGLMNGAAVVMTDSGGIQEETTALGVPCVTLREQTERPITVTEGTNRLISWPLTAAGVVSAFRAAVRERGSLSGDRRPEGWDGKAAERIVAALENRTVPFSPLL